MTPALIQARPQTLRALRGDSGFTLIESLVAIAVLAILLGIAAAVYLGQVEKADDSEAKQYLALAYKAAQAESVSNDGEYVHVDGTLEGAEAMAEEIKDSGVLADPEQVNSLNLDGFFVLGGERAGQSGGTQTVSGGPKQIIVDAASTPKKLILYNTVELIQDSDPSGQVRECTLVADGYNVAPEIDCVVYAP